MLKYNNEGDSIDDLFFYTKYERQQLMSWALKVFITKLNFYCPLVPSKAGMLDSTSTV